jgi:hypothetical protein
MEKLQTYYLNLQVKNDEDSLSQTSQTTTTLLIPPIMITIDYFLRVSAVGVNIMHKVEDVLLLELKKR